MKPFKSVFTFFASVAFCFWSVTASADTITVKEKDSVNNAMLKSFQQKLAMMERQQIEDSIARADLLEKINSSKNTEMQSALQKQLNELSTAQQLREIQKKTQIDSLKKKVKGSPVIGFFNDTLFVIYNKMGSFSASDRARAVSERIKKMSILLRTSSDSLIVAEGEGSSDITFGENVIVSVTDIDALWNNTSRKDLAYRYKQIINNSIAQYHFEINIGTLAKEIGLAILVILIVGFGLRYISRFFVWSAKKIEEQENKLIKGIAFKNYTLFDAHRQVEVLLMVNKFVKWLVILVVIYVALPILFGIFPWTRDFADTLFGYILNPIKKIAIGLWNYLPNLITIIVILFVFKYVMKGITFLKTEIEKGDLTISGFYPDWANPTYQIVKVLVAAFAVVVIFPYLPGSDSPVFQGVSVFLGFLFTFGSAGSLSNIIAGLVLTYMRLFKIGDRVKIGEVMGDVIEKSMLVTRVRTPKNEIISIPNSTVMNSHTINYSSDAPEKGLIVHTTVTIGYDVPWRDMHRILIEAAGRTELLLAEPVPFVLQTSLDDFYVSYQINAYTNEPNKQSKIYSDLHQNIQDVCNENGVEILSPHYRAARDGNMVTIPANYLADDYKAPSFRVKIKK